MAAARSSCRPFQVNCVLRTRLFGLARLIAFGERDPVRLRGQRNRAVEVRSCAAKSRAVSNRNCPAAMRGGEQRNQNDQSVTQAAHVGCRRELDSVGMDGRVGWITTKPLKRARGLESPDRRTTGQSSVVAPRVGDGRAGSPPAVIRETRRGQAVFMATARRAARRESERP